MAGQLPSLADISFVEESALHDLFIVELERVGFIAIAEQRLGLKGCYRKWVEADGGEQFAGRAYDAERAFNGVIVAEMVRRGIHGVPRRKFYKGCEITIWNEETQKYEPYIEHEYSDGLLQSLAQAKMPEFRTSRQEVEISGAMGVEHSGAVKVGVRVLEHDDWYGTNNTSAPHRLAAASNGSSAGGSAVSGSIQGGGVRSEMGKNGDWFDDGPEGPRGIQGSVEGGD